MAKNKLFKGDTITAAVAGKLSGDPVVVGQIPGVALTDTDADGKVVVDTRGVFDLSVKAVDGVGNSAVAVGDAIYYVETDTPKLSKKNTGVLFGWALKAIAAGATDTIQVLLRR